VGEGVLYRRPERNLASFSLGSAARKKERKK